MGGFWGVWRVYGQCRVFLGCSWIFVAGLPDSAVQGFVPQGFLDFAQARKGLPSRGLQVSLQPPRKRRECSWGSVTTPFENLGSLNSTTVRLHRSPVTTKTFL